MRWQLPCICNERFVILVVPHLYNKHFRRILIASTQCVHLS